MADVTPQVKFGIDAVAGTTLVAAFFQWVPIALATVGGIMSIFWIGLQILTHPWMVDYLDRRRENKRAIRLRALLAKQKTVQAQILAASVITKAKIRATEVIEAAKTDAALTATFDKNIDLHNS